MNSKTHSFDQSACLHRPNAGLGLAFLPGGVFDLLLPQGALAAQRAGTGDGVAPPGPGVGDEEGTRYQQPGNRERNDTNDEQAGRHRAQGQERDGLDHRAQPEDQEPADGGEDRGQGKRGE